MMKAFFLASLAFLVLTQSFAQFGVTRRVSTTVSGREVFDQSTAASVSGGGRYVAFQCRAPEMALGGTSNVRNIFVKDTLTGAIEQLSLNYNGSQPVGHSNSPQITPDGRYVVFINSAAQIIQGITGQTAAVYRKDRWTGMVVLVSRNFSGNPTGWCNSPIISDDGRFIAFNSIANDLVPGDTNGVQDVFVRDMLTGTNQRASVSHNGQQTQFDSWIGDLSADGSTVTFFSDDRLTASDSNNFRDVFAFNRPSGTIEMVSVGIGGGQPNAHSTYSSTSGNGRYVLFQSSASNLVNGDTNNTSDVFLRDRVLQTTERVSVSQGGTQGNGWSEIPEISDDGTVVVFSSLANNFAPNDNNNESDVFLKELASGAIRIVSNSTTGVQVDDYIKSVSIDSSNRFVSFTTDSGHPTPDDQNAFEDVFLHDTLGRWTLPKSFSILQGSSVGTLGSLLNSDDDRMVITAINGEVGVPQAQLQIGGLSPVATPDALEICLEASTTARLITVAVSLYDFSEKAYVRVNVRTFGLVDRYMVTHVNDASRFIGPTDEVRAKIEFWNEWPLFVSSWQAKIDHVYWTFCPSVK